MKSAINVKDLVLAEDALYQAVHSNVMQQQQRMRDVRSRGKFPNFVEG